MSSSLPLTGAAAGVTAGAAAGVTAGVTAGVAVGPATATAPVVLPAARAAAWLAGTALAALAAYYFIGVDQGAYSVFGQDMHVHEFVHDARHFLGFPCH
jgi:hypothetical protein